MNIGIIGLPNSGKTTVFNALTRGQVETAAYSAGRMEVHSASVQVPDERLEIVRTLFHTPRCTYAHVQYNDIAGLARGIGEAGGLAGPLLNEISQNDALLLVVCAFQNANVLHPEGSVDPERDAILVETELILNDMQIISGRLERIESRIGKGGNPKETDMLKAEKLLLDRLMNALENEIPLRDVTLNENEEKTIRGYGFLSQKPLLILLNVEEDADEYEFGSFAVQGDKVVTGTLRGKLEEELAQMEPEEAQEFLVDFGIAEPGLSRIIHLSYQLLQVQSFFTVNEEEVRAWTLPVGDTALQAAGTVHTDLARGFIRAEVIAYDDLVATGSMAEARNQGKLRLEGREYVVQDGDIIQVRFAL